jgi:hypothetical protein
MRLRRLAPFGLALVLGACAGTGEPPPYDAVPASAARLSFAAPGLQGEAARHFHADREEAGYTVDRSRWDAPGGAAAELMMIETRNPRGLAVPGDPQDEVANFADLVKLKSTFGTLYQSETAMGPAIWRRFVAGDRSCVIFSQRWDKGPGTPVERTLFGYYCAPSGVPFDLQDAQAVLRFAAISR